MSEIERIIEGGAISERFLQPETICDFYVDGKRKKIWAIQLDLLKEFQRVCNSHSIKYMACGGTILGAVRHQGFIPWDDDIDVMMSRSEYDRFCQIAPSEFKHPYFFQTAATDPGYLIRHAKIRNNCTADFSMGFSKYRDKCKFNQGIFIDLFPLDNIPDSLEERSSFFSLLWNTWGKVWKQITYVNYGLRFSQEENEFLYRQISEDQAAGQFHLYREYEKLSAKYMSKSTMDSYIICLCRLPGNTNERFGWCNTDLQETILMPFEMLQIPVPKNYDNVLRKTYGNWKEFVKGGALHSAYDDTLFDTEHSYNEYLKGGGFT